MLQQQVDRVDGEIDSAVIDSAGALRCIHANIVGGGQRATLVVRRTVKMSVLTAQT